MPKNEFKYYALHYLNLWVAQDKPCCEALDGSDDSKKLAALADAAVFYRIARNLPTRHDEGKGLQRYGPVLKIIDTLNPADFGGENLLPPIKKVRDEISHQYGGDDILSLTTKFLWLKMKSPIIIYDRLARVALDVAPRKIEEYYGQWREKFNGFDQQIREACVSLRDVHEYVENPEIATPQYIATTAAQQWFRERVFDVYLWRIGSKKIMAEKKSKA
ncbi:MAG: hypothetical protein WBL63_26310 [Candidatus Acidiferrum sp.]